MAQPGIGTKTAASLVSLLALVVMTEYRSDGQFGAESRYEPFHGANFISTWGIFMPAASLLYFSNPYFMRLSLSVATATVLMWVLVIAITGSPNWDGENTLVIDLVLVYLGYIPISATVMARILYDTVDPDLPAAERRAEFVYPLVVFMSFYYTVVCIHEQYSQYSTFGDEFRNVWRFLVLGFFLVLSIVHGAYYIAERRIAAQRR